MYVDLRHTSKRAPKATHGRQPPAVPARLRFNRLALAAATVRASTTRDAHWAITRGLELREVWNLLTLTHGQAGFGLRGTAALIDAFATSLPAGAGAGITHLVMQQMGYAWLDHGAHLAPHNVARPDMVYSGHPFGPAEVVAVEATGSFADQYDPRDLIYRTTAKFDRQVADYLGKRTLNGGRIAHGYAVGFGCSPHAPGADLVVIESDLIAPSGPSTALAASPPNFGTVLGSFAATFKMIGAPSASDWCSEAGSGRRDRPGASPVRKPTVFRRILYDGRAFLIGRGSGYRGTKPFFALEEETALSFIVTLKNYLSGDEPRFERGFGQASLVGVTQPDDDERLFDGPERDPPLVMFRDGLAMLNLPAEPHTDGDVEIDLS
jgi:hypothetical protein